MGNYFTLHAYDADVWIPAFRGIDQADIGLNPNLTNAAVAENVETKDGVLQPKAACPFLAGSFTNRVETLACFHRRWFQGNGSKDWYVCCTGGKFYYKQSGSAADWFQIEMPTGVTSYNSSLWSWVTYETNPPGSSAPVDILLLSNGKDGMIKITPPDTPTTWNDVKSHDWTWVYARTWQGILTPGWHITPVDTRGKKFGVIERYAERIWGAAIPDDPDMLMYSKAFYADDWNQDSDIPEDNSGDIMQPSWDGDSFQALHRFGDHLLAFKKHRIWEVLNTNPGDYVFKEQFGEGTSYFNTIGIYKERVFMESDDGLMVYDGLSTTPYAHEQVEQIWKTVNRDAMDQMCAAVFRDKYYVAFPTGSSAVNNAMLVYDLKEGTILYYPNFYIEAFLPTDDELFATSSTAPGKIMRIRYDSWSEGLASGDACKWVTPWIDFGYKRINKGGFDLYLIPEVKTQAVTLQISVQTEKKMKTKTYTVQPLTAEQIANNKEHRGKRLHFGGAGRKFRVIIETAQGVTAPWRLIGGLQLVVETDPD